MDSIQNVQIAQIRHMSDNIGSTLSTHPSKTNEMDIQILRLTQRLDTLKQQRLEEKSIFDQSCEDEPLPQRPRTTAKHAAKSALVVNTSKAKINAAIPSTQESDEDIMETEHPTSSSQKRAIHPSVSSKNANSLETDQLAPQLRF